MSALDTSFRTLLVQLIKEQELTVVEAAGICGIPANQFVALVHGPMTTTLPEASRILRRLGVSVRLERVSVHVAS
jgi:plasmid maintenance system antidote protein VapI